MLLYYLKVKMIEKLVLKLRYLGSTEASSIYSLNMPGLKHTQT
jgi:hypothetical protein